jgi:hypothetical protein
MAGHPASRGRPDYFEAPFYLDIKSLDPISASISAFSAH